MTFSSKSRGTVSSSKGNPSPPFHNGRSSTSSAYSFAPPGRRESNAQSSEFFQDEEVPTNRNSSKSNKARSVSDKRVPLTANKPRVSDRDQSSLRGGGDGGRSNRRADKLSSNRKPRSLILGMSKPVFAGACVLGMVAATVTAYSLMELMPRRSEVNDLEEQVDRLKGEVNRLQVQNDRYETSNDQLNTSIANFRLENQRLNETRKHMDASIERMQDEIP